MKKACLFLFVLLSSCKEGPSFSVEEVTVQSKVNNVSIAGTLTLPNGKGPFKGVILLAGTGKMDRDQTFEGHKFFKVLANYLAENGIASYRYDKRGVGESTGSFETATLEDFASDAFVALEFLKSHPKISEVGFIGQSEGGKVAPLATLNNNLCDFLVLMAPPGLPLDQASLNQTKAMLSARGISKDNIQKQLIIEAQIWNLVKSKKDIDSIRIEVEKTIRSNIDDYYYLKNVVKEGLEKAIIDEVNWFVNSLNFNEIHGPYYSSDFFKKIKCPVFILTGDKDLFVVYPEEFNYLKGLIETNREIKSTFKVYPNVNHLFQTCETGLYEEVSKISETINPHVMRDIANWIKGFN